MSFRIHSEKITENDIIECVDNLNIDDTITNTVKRDINKIQPLPNENQIIYFKNLSIYMDNLQTTLPIIELKQSDFTNGTYRIKNPGYYKLVENIVFNPNKSSWDGTKLIGDDWMPTQQQIQGGKNAIYPIAPFGPYHLGFFASISIESDNVIIDLNNYTLSQSIEHYLQQRFFSLIELASSPFIPKQGPSNFGQPVFFPKFVKIFNGNLGLSSHQAIHGNGMKDIILQNLNIYDYEQAGIALNGGENMMLYDINIGKNSRNVFINASYSQSRFLRSFLHNIINNSSNPNPSITINNSSLSGQDILDNLTIEMDSVYKDVIIDNSTVSSSLFKNDSLLIDGAIYGIVFNVLGVAVNKFLPSLDNTNGNKNIYIQNLQINNLDSNPQEILGLSINNNNNNDNYGKKAQKGPVGDVFNIIHVTDNNGFYIPNVLANAQCYISKYKHLISSGSASIESNIFDNWISSPTPLDPLISNNYYVCGGDSMAHVMKGNIALFLSGCQDIQLYNVDIINIKNSGLLADSEKCDVNNSLIYDGNRTRAIAVILNKNLFCKNLNIRNISSFSADSIAIDFIGNSDFVDINGYNIQNIIQADIINSGYFPNVPPASYIFKNTHNVTNLKFSQIIQ